MPAAGLRGSAWPVLSMRNAKNLSPARLRSLVKPRREGDQQIARMRMMAEARNVGKGEKAGTLLRCLPLGFAAPDFGDMLLRVPANPDAPPGNPGAPKYGVPGLRKRPRYRNRPACRPYFRSSTTTGILRSVRDW